jgi:hypothetical protein
MRYGLAVRQRTVKRTVVLARTGRSAFALAIDDPVRPKE